ncbi:Os05g0193600 [Oryza sativa Japonica Group]|uniref:Os05g0193600 protein n=1 Tax=Oryza sativa subsp. japonica TaxID=39947 RepID=Q688P8_ORYSJ|nr:unknown protein [Oryza sativa Japonica Group]BAH92987.1 Os05g0193600 [Oryza sativa Japonica Group]|eukprot:NP_001174259.1 Os05g0193600 [Oryza sativa Japonica Group]
MVVRTQLTRTEKELVRSCPRICQLYNCLCTSFAHILLRLSFFCHAGTEDHKINSNRKSHFIDND